MTRPDEPTLIIPACFALALLLLQTVYLVSWWVGELWVRVKGEK